MTMLAIEAQTSQVYVRNYFTDIEGPVVFYAVNTTLSSGLLYTTFLLLAFSVLADPARWDGQATLFLTQALFCLYLAIDDRFKFHERLTDLTGVNDPYIMAGISLAVLGAYLIMWRPWMFTWPMAVALTAAAGFFFVMLVFDALMPHDMFMRLSIEDLSKTWSAFMFAFLAWEGARYRLIGIPRGERGIALPARFVPAIWRDGIGLGKARGQQGGSSGPAATAPLGA
ncbi:MAG: hypothetical protein ABW128_17775 [Rhizorhabdus sp.]